MNGPLMSWPRHPLCRWRLGFWTSSMRGLPIMERKSYFFAQMRCWRFWRFEFTLEDKASYNSTFPWWPR